MSRHHRIAAAAAAAALAVLAGCSSSGDDAADSSAPTASATSSATSSAASTSAASTSAATSGAASGEDTLTAALIAVTDVGTGYQETSTGTTDSPLPCTPDDRPLFVQAAPAQKVQKSFVNGASTVQVGETVAEYSEDSGAQQAFTVGEKGFTCRQGVIGGQKVTIAKRASTPSGEVDQIAAWDFAAGQLKGTAVIARVDDHIAALTFSAVGTAGNSVAVAAIVNRAIAKVVAND